MLEIASIRFAFRANYAPTYVGDPSHMRQELTGTDRRTYVLGRSAAHEHQALTYIYFGQN